MEEFLKNKYGIDSNTRLNSEEEYLLVRDLVSMLQEKGAEKNVINNLHNSTLNQGEVLAYLDNVSRQLVMEDKN